MCTKEKRCVVHLVTKIAEAWEMDTMHYSPEHELGDRIPRLLSPYIPFEDDTEPVGWIEGTFVRVRDTDQWRLEITVHHNACAMSVTKAALLYTTVPRVQFELASAHRASVEAGTFDGDELRAFSKAIKAAEAQGAKVVDQLRAAMHDPSNAAGEA